MILGSPRQQLVYSYLSAAGRFDRFVAFDPRYGYDLCGSFVVRLACFAVPRRPRPRLASRPLHVLKHQSFLRNAVSFAYTCQQTTPTKIENSTDELTRTVYFPK